MPGRHSVTCSALSPVPAAPAKEASRSPSPATFRACRSLRFRFAVSSTDPLSLQSHGAAVLPSAPSSGKPCFRRCRRLCADLSPHSREKNLRLPAGMIYASGLPRTVYLSAQVFPLPQNTPTGGARCRCYPADETRNLENTESKGRLYRSRPRSATAGA